MPDRVRGAHRWSRALSAPAPGRVLFVGAQPVDAAVTAVLRELGHPLLHAPSPEAAAPLVRAGCVALILVSSEGDPRGLCATIAELRTLAEARQTPIVALGLSPGDVNTLAPLFDAGAIAALHAPVSPTILRAKARFYLQAFATAAERRRAEDELRRVAADLAEADRLKTEFLATLAHELRNPLAPIRSGLQYMRRAQPDAATLTRVQDIIDRQLDHLVHLVDDLLDVARITRGQVELRREWIDLAEVLGSAVDTSLPLIEAARHRLDVKLPQEPVRLWADPTRLTQVISNLLNNAAKYTPRGGALVLAAECDGHEAVIAVADNGIGIDKTVLQDVFRMFTRIGSDMHNAPGGLGIGLSLVRSLVELHGGSVHAASEGANAGSVFTVRLPLSAPGAPPLPAPAASAAAEGPQRRLRVLVVDDNRDAADTLAALLDSLGHTAPVANDGHQALRMIDSFAPQVVFLDLGMPGMSGYEVAAEVRRTPRLNGVKLVALTGWGGAEDRARSAAAGFDLHLTKPATVASLEQVLAQI